jgi:hypothetical protein
MIEQILNSIKVRGVAQDSTLQSLLTELQLKAKLTDIQPVDINSLPLATDAATETKQDDILTALGLLAKLTDTQPVKFKSDMYDAGGGFVVSNKTTLGAYLMDSNNISTQLSRQGTGTQVYSNGVSTMSVTSGQYAVCQSRQIHPYLTGKAQECEITCDRFNLQTNVVKKIGLFTSARTAPYNTSYDGFYFEADGINGVYNLVIANGNTGLETKIPSSSWDNPNITNFGANFNILKIDFLYLGGSQVRFWIFNNGTFELLHTYKHANNFSGTICKSPNLPVRWEIRSTTGSGTFGQICATVTTGGSLNKVGRQIAVPPTITTTTANTAGTSYLLKAIRLSNTTGINKTILDFIISAVSSAGDDLWIEVRFNPTIAGGALTWNDINDENSVATGIQYANGSGNIITGGTVIYGDYIGAVNRTVSTISTLDLIRKAGFDLNGVADILTLCVIPLNTGTNANVYGNFTVTIN